MVENKPRPKIWGHKLRFGVIKHRDGLWAGLDHLLGTGRCVFSAGTLDVKLMEVYSEPQVVGHSWLDPALGRSICLTSVPGARCSSACSLRVGASLTPGELPKEKTWWGGGPWPAALHCGTAIPAKHREHGQQQHARSQRGSRTVLLSAAFALADHPPHNHHPPHNQRLRSPSPRGPCNYLPHQRSYQTSAKQKVLPENDAQVPPGSRDKLPTGSRKQIPSVPTCALQRHTRRPPDRSSASEGHPKTRPSLSSPQGKTKPSS